MRFHPVNFPFTEKSGDSQEGSMLIGLQVTLAIFLIAATLKAGRLVSDNMEAALGEKPLRDRAGEER
jgi:hypothetical protein